MDEVLPPDHPDRLIGEMFELLDESRATRPSDPPRSQELRHVSSVNDVPLRMMARTVAEVIRAFGSIESRELVPSYARHFGLEVPPDMRRFVTKFAWSAKGHRFVTLTGTTWEPGSVPPRELEQFGEWTLSLAVRRARELLAAGEEEDAFEQLVSELYVGSDRRVPRIVMSVAGKAIYRAQRDQ
jgi:hypothetical protein